MDVKLTVLGCAGTHVSASRMCSSYLLEADGFRFVVDLGNGSLSNLQKRIDVAQIDALLISHLHPDHFADIYSLYYALRFHADGQQSLPVYAPPGARDVVAQLVDDRETLEAVCRFSEARAGDILTEGPFRVSLFAANHPVDTLAARFSASGKVAAYSSDSAVSPAIVDCARDADVLVADCSWLEAQRPLPEGVHMTAREAGLVAAEAGARRLVVTHVFPGNDAADAAAEAASGYDGEVIIAEDLLELTL